MTIPVPDVDAGLAFYRDALGLSVTWRNDALGQIGLGLPDADTELVLTTQHGYEPNWLVDSVDSALKRIVAAGGAVVVEAVDIPVGRIGVVRDPFGSALVLIDLSKGTYLTDDHGSVVGVHHK